MKHLHLICRRDPNGIGRFGVSLLDAKANIYLSGKWVFSLEEAKRLLGGMILLHETKSDPSTFGGIVTGVQETVSDEKGEENRVEFIFKATLEAKGVAWSGTSHSMAWTSGIIDSDAK